MVREANNAVIPVIAVMKRLRLTKNQDKMVGAARKIIIIVLYHHPDGFRMEAAYRRLVIIAGRKTIGSVMRFNLNKMLRENFIRRA